MTTPVSALVCGGCDKEGFIGGDMLVHKIAIYSITKKSGIETFETQR